MQPCSIPRHLGERALLHFDTSNSWYSCIAVGTNDPPSTQLNATKKIKKPTNTKFPKIKLENPSKLERLSGIVVVLRARIQCIYTIRANKVRNRHFRFYSGVFSQAAAVLSSH